MGLKYLSQDANQGIDVILSNWYYMEIPLRDPVKAQD